MNEAKAKEGVVIDVAPERAADTAADPAPAGTAAAPPDPAARPTGRQRSGALAATLSVLAILLVGAGLVLGYLRGEAMKREIGALDQRLAATLAEQTRLQAALDAADAAVQSQQQALAAQQARLGEVLAGQQQAAQEQLQALRQNERLLAEERRQTQTRAADLREAIADLHRRIGGSGNQWMVAEAEYLVRLAGHRLELARDVLTARAALELADQRLRDTREPGWEGVREQLASDLAALTAIPLPDTAAISERLAAVAGRLSALPVPGAGQAARAVDRAAATTTPAAPSERTLGTAWDDFLGGLKDAVRVRRNDQPLPAGLAPEHHEFLLQNLRLQLAIARLALVRGERLLYRDSLNSAAGLLADHFDPTAQGVGEVHRTLQELAAIDIAPPLPRLDGVLGALQARQRLLDDRGAVGTPPGQPQ